jgi:hypothetical protein
MFFEEQREKGSPAVIAAAISIDGYSWRYLGLALQRPYHLSYPFVFWYAPYDMYVMIPETNQAKCIQVYGASKRDFPTTWKLLFEKLCGRHMADTSIIFWNNMTIIFSGESGGGYKVALELYTAHELNGNWVPHPANPISRNATISRPGGRPYIYADRLHRWAQDGSHGYGRAVHSLIVDVNLTHYSESIEFSIHPCKECIFKSNVHHVDFQPSQNGKKALVLVDGF